MKKAKVKYVCTSCGYETLRWMGRCPTCDNWNTFSEEITETETSRKPTARGKRADVARLDEISGTDERRVLTGIAEFDRVLGGGFIPGSVVLIGGDPGIGKSTLVLQAVSKIKGDVLYVSGEESARQISMRASRLRLQTDNIYLLPETDMGVVLAAVAEKKPVVVVIDSIQTMYSNRLENAPGTVTQVRESTAAILEDAKKNNYVAVIIGHVTKDGMIAGPKLLEHIVDTVIQFEGDTGHAFRIMRAKKNRFGSTNEIGIFEMHDTGLTEVANPSEVFLSGRQKQTPGSCVASSIEGTRPLLVEVQALVTPSHFGNPQRVASGFDLRRLSILLAVLEKRCGCRLSAANVFLNIAGGVRIEEPAADLAVCCAVASGLLDKVVDTEAVAIGEVGLGGELRSVGQLEKRIQEAEKLGFRRIFVPGSAAKSIKPGTAKLYAMESVQEVLQLILR